MRSLKFLYHQQCLFDFTHTLLSPSVLSTYSFNLLLPRHISLALSSLFYGSLLRHGCFAFSFYIYIYIGMFHFLFQYLKIVSAFFLQLMLLIIPFLDSQGLHIFGNAREDRVAVSLHIYSPPYTECFVFNPANGAKVLVPMRKKRERCFDAPPFLICAKCIRICFDHIY